MSDKIENHLLVGSKFTRKRVTKAARLKPTADALINLDNHLPYTGLRNIYDCPDIINGLTICNGKDVVPSSTIVEHSKLAEIIVDIYKVGDSLFTGSQSTDHLLSSRLK